jgi:cation transport protein ChaC
MWIFGYGSLLWDWEPSCDCIRRVLADLPGYCRTFNKASVRNWGTKNAPGPTLNLRGVHNGICLGIAFEFADDCRKQILADLTKREGIAPIDVTVRLDGGSDVVASVTLYTGKNIIVGKNADEIISMIRSANGERGSCVAYVKGLYDKLHDLGIEDTEVEAIWQAVQ